MSTSPDYSKIIDDIKKRWIWIIIIPAWVMLSFFVSQIIVYILFAIVGNFLQSIFNTVVINLIAQVLSYLIILFFIIAVPWAIKKKNKITKKDIGLDRLLQWRELIVSPAALVVYFIFSMILISIVSNLVPSFDVNQAQETGFEGINKNYEYIVAFLALVVIAPFAEEIIFRGYLFSRLKKYAPVWLAIIITSATFGAAHMAWNLAIDTFALSVVACVLREMFGSIWPSILIHMMKNGLAYYLLFINPDLLTKLGG